MFHHNPNISGGGWDDRYQVQYYTLFDLADLNQDNAAVDAYFKDAAKIFQQHGVDGFRLDTVKHVTWKRVTGKIVSTDYADSADKKNRKQGQ